MSRLTLNSEPYERDRGLIFSETFTSSSAITENGGTEVGSPTISNGVLTVDADGKYIDYLNLRRPTTEMTFMAWVYPTVAPDGTGRVIMSDYDYNAGSDGGWIFGDGYGSNDHLQFEINALGVGSATANYTGFYAAHLNSWVHVAGTYVGGSYVKVFVNGVEVAEDASSVPASILYTNSYFGRIGLRSDDNSVPQSTGTWRGDIKDVKMFTQALNADEILAYYNNTQEDYKTGITLDMPMNMANYDPTNTQVLDISGNENHGTIVASPIKSTFETGMYFNSSSSQYINIPTLTDPITGDFTMSGFVKCRGHLGGTSDDFSTAFGCGDWSGTHVRGCCLRSQEATNQLKFDYGTGTSSGTKTIHNPFIPNYENRWIHVALTYTSATTRVVAYSNGEVVSAATEAIGNTVGGDTYQIGASSGLNTGEDFWFGSLALIKFWDSKALTDMQVKKLYQDDLQELKRI